MNDRYNCKTRHTSDQGTKLALTTVGISKSLITSFVWFLPIKTESRMVLRPLLISASTLTLFFRGTDLIVFIVRVGKVEVQEGGLVHPAAVLGAPLVRLPLFTLLLQSLRPVL